MGDFPKIALFTTSSDFELCDHRHRKRKSEMGILKEAIMKVAVMNTSHLKKLAQIGIALSAEKDINKLLEIIVDEARSLTGADGGTLYLVDKQKMQLRFEILQNDTMKMRMGGTTGAEITLPPVPLFNTGGTQPFQCLLLRRANGEDIPLLGRICSVADVFDAVTSQRPYREAFSEKEAYRVLREGQGSQFDQRVVDVFFARRDEIAAIQKPSIENSSIQGTCYEVA